MLMSGATVDKKRGYSSSPSSSTPKSGISLLISQTVFLGQIFLQLMLMGHFGLEWDKRKADEAFPASRVQSPKATVSKEFGLKDMGFSKGANGFTEAGHMGHFNQGIATTQAQRASVKGKKDFARSRAHIPSVSVATGSMKLP